MKLKGCKYCNGKSPTCPICNDDGTFDEDDVYKSQTLPKKTSSIDKKNVLKKYIVAFPLQKFLSERNNDLLLLKHIQEAIIKKADAGSFKLKLKLRFWYWYRELEQEYANADL